MSYIPNVREKFKTPLFQNTQGSSAEKEINYYWQGYLDEMSAQFLAGFDWAILMVVRNFFDNIDMFEDGKHDISADDINLSICEFFEKHRDKLDGFRQCLEEWAEMGRNELAVSLIEGMDDKELEKRMATVENGEKNCLYQFEFEEETIDSGYVKYDET